MTSTRRKQTDIVIDVSPTDLIPIASFDSIPLSRYFFNPATDDILLYHHHSFLSKSFVFGTMNTQKNMSRCLRFIDDGNDMYIIKSFNNEGGTQHFSFVNDSYIMKQLKHAIYNIF